MKKAEVFIEAISVVSAVASIFWLYSSPGLEPLIATLGALVVILGIGVSAQVKLSKALDESLEKKLCAIREIRRVVSDIPGITRREFIQKLSTDDQFRRQLTSRLVRLLGLRVELAPYLEPELADLIDGEFEPLFIVELGQYTFKNEKIIEFINFSEKIVEMAKSIERNLTGRYRTRFG